MEKSVIKQLLYKKTWEAFYAEKDKFHRLNNKEKKLLNEMLADNSYKTLTQDISTGNYAFSTAKKIIINKVIAEKKRTVYSYTLKEQLWLKVLAKQLRRYSTCLSPYCFSGSDNGGSKRAFKHIISDRQLKNKYAYKIDIANYFNTINIDLMLEILRIKISDNPLIDLIAKLLENPNVIYRDQLIQEQKGIMAGTPLSSFLANLYLTEMDAEFYQRGITYARYADDIIVFAHEEELSEVIATIAKYLDKYQLSLNHTKTKIIKPQEAFDFLGFNYNNGIIDLSQATIIKTKKKIRRAARSLVRAQHKKDFSLEKALTLMIKKFNRKFFLIRQDTDLNWTLWYFPVINTSKSLRLLDIYYQQQLRYMCSGSHTKKNYKYIDYAYLKKLGYRTLINEYYKFSKSRSLKLTALDL